jgi:hypothetical protein
MDRIETIAHDMAFDLLFVLKRLVKINFPPQLVMNGRTLSLNVENVTRFDSLNYLAMHLRKLSETFGVTTEKSQYAHLFNTTESTKYVGPAPDVSYYGLGQMRDSEMAGFLLWIDTVAKIEAFDNRLLLERYCKEDITLLREARRTFSDTSCRSGMCFSNV